MSRLRGSAEAYDFSTLYKGELIMYITVEEYELYKQLYEKYEKICNLQRMGMILLELLNGKTKKNDTGRLGN